MEKIAAMTRPIQIAVAIKNTVAKSLRKKLQHAASHLGRKVARITAIAAKQTMRAMK